MTDSTPTPRTPQRLRSLAVGALAVGASASVLLGATGCGQTKTTTVTSTVRSAPSPKPVVLPSEPAFKGASAGAASDVTISKCGTDAGSQKASGTVTNSTKKARDYEILIMWMKNGDGHPYGAAMATLKGVQPGKATNWSVTATVSQKVDTCAKHVVAGTIK